MEYIYQYLWRHRLFGRSLQLTDGRPVEVLRPGRLNLDSGPDFFNALLAFEGRKVAGDVEIHVRASDWARHGHHRDPAYETVALHVVGQADSSAFTLSGRLLPVLSVSVPEGFSMTWEELTADRRGVRCSNHMPALSPLEKADWLGALAYERMEERAERVGQWLSESGGDWNRTFFIALARGLGFSLNGLPFELLAKSIPLNFLGRHADNPLQVEALLFGQAGMLAEGRFPEDSYYKVLCREYRFLRAKYDLRPLEPGVWKYSRIRPTSFPHRMVAMLARFVEPGLKLFDGLRQCSSNLDRLLPFFDRELRGYWAEHSAFGQEEATLRPRGVRLGKAKSILLAVNVAVPVLYAHALHHGDYELRERAADLLASLPPENNSVIGEWRRNGLDPADSMESQALMQLRREYCDAFRCRDCRFAYHHLKRNTPVAR